MTSSVIVPSKNTGSRVPISYPFADQLQFGETITGVSIQIVVYSGVDPAPATMLFGAASVNGTTVTQVFSGGIDGVIYETTALVTGSAGHIYSKGAKLAIVNSPEAFIGA